MKPISGPLRKQILLGLGSALLNPKNALFYLALMTALLGPDVTLAGDLRRLDGDGGAGVGSGAGIAGWDRCNRSSAVRLADRTHGGVVLMGFGGGCCGDFCIFPRFPLSLTHGKNS
jgi:hypothetical protein